MNASKTPGIISEPTHDEIALCAYMAWEKEGRQPGREMSYWFEAEAQLRAMRRKSAVAATPAPTAAPKPTAKAQLPRTSKLASAARR